MDLPATQLQHVLEPRAAAMKFTYNSGSRPLEGYTIKRGIGQGGFGEVYYATSDAGKEVALKLIRRNLDVELRGVTQCLNLKHANLLALYDIKVDDRGDSWVVMEYVPGESLEDVLARHPQGMPIDEAMLWFHGIAAGVAYLHDRGIVHRDLKPGNIFNDDGQVKIGDYGLSKFISASRRSGQTESVGTVHYMAPEIANGRYGKEIDLYALGVILYELLSGQVPFEGESVGEVLMKHMTAEPDVSRVPVEYRELVARSLAKDPEKRPTSVAEFLAALPASAARVPAAPSLASGPRRDPMAEVDSGLAETTVLRRPGTPPPPPPGVAAAGASPTKTADQWHRDATAAIERFRAWFHTLAPRQKVGVGVGVALSLYVAMSMLTAVARAEASNPRLGALSGVVLTLLVLLGFKSIGLIGHKPAVAGAPSTPRTPPRMAEGAAGASAAMPVGMPAVPQVARYSRRERRQLRRDSARRGLPPKSPRDKFTELVGSLLLSAAVAAAASLLMLIVQSRDEQFYAEYAWLGLCGTVGAWGVLIPAKFWEGRQGDVVLRRFVLLGVGLAFGLFAWETGRHLQILLANEIELPHVQISGRTSFSAEGQPEVMAYLAYFGFLFLLIRWWRQADPLRDSRLSIWSTVVCVFWAGALYAFWPFPQPWGMMMAGTISLAVQLSSPWIDPQNRVARVTATPAA